MHHGCALTHYQLFITMGTNVTQDVSYTDKERFRLVLNEKTGSVSVAKSLKRIHRKKKSDAWFYLGFVGEIGYAIALPIVGGALLGEYIDRRMSTHPKATLLLLLLGIVVSMLGFVRTIQELIKRKN